MDMGLLDECDQEQFVKEYHHMALTIIGQTLNALVADDQAQRATIAAGLQLSAEDQAAATAAEAYVATVVNAGVTATAAATNTAGSAAASS